MTRRCLLFMLAAIATAALSAAAEDQDRGVPTLTVRGEAELTKPADQLRVSVGVVTEDASAAAALDANSRRMNNVVKAIKKAGVDDDQYQTGRFQIRPKYARRPRQPAPDWQPQIVGYEVTNTIDIRTPRLDFAGELIETVNTAGANSVDAVGFDLADPRVHRAEAISTATANAIDDARTLADAASLRLVRILSINLDNTRIAPVHQGVNVARQAMTAERGGAAPPISAGDVMVRASVTVVYEVDGEVAAN